MRRRDFIAAIGGAAVWSYGVPAQTSVVKRIGVLMTLAAEDPEARARIAALTRALQQRGWVQGQNLRIDYRWDASSGAALRRNAEELVALAPDVLLTAGSPMTVALQQATHTIPIIFTVVSDPVSLGVVKSLAKPGLNATGFLSIRWPMSLKWLQLLQEISPSLTRAGIIVELAAEAGINQWNAVQSAASKLKIEITPISFRSVGELERGIGDFARSPGGGLVATATPAIAIHRDLIVALAAAHQIPAIYPYRYFCASGGLVSYGIDTIDQFSRAAEYVDRILNGERPAELPVQAAVKFHLTINLKAAKAIGLAVPEKMLGRADEVIE
jgi:ABC-type uncharacterized transport system substrate-binding protein